MIRRGICILSALIVWLLAAGAALAQADAWPATPEPFARGPGLYLSAVKIGVVWLLFLAWIRTTDWISRDCGFYRLRAETWVPATFFSFLASLLLLFVLPSFWLAFPLMLFAYGVPLGLYLSERGKIAKSHHEGGALDALNDFVMRTAASIGIKLPAAGGGAQTAAADLTLSMTGDRPTPPPVLNSEGFAPASELVADALDYRAGALLLEHTDEATALCYHIDGIWYRADSLDVSEGAAMLATFKGLAGLKPAEHRARQQGAFKAAEDGDEERVRQFACHFACQGTAAGERAVLNVDSVQVPFESLTDLGLRPQLEAQLKEAVSQSSGLVVFSAPPGNGLTALVDTALQSCDRITRDFVAVEEKDHRQRELENVSVVTYSAAANQTPASVLSGAIGQDPNVLIARDLADAATVQALCQQAMKDRLVLGTIWSYGAAEALLRVLALKVSAQALANSLLMVIHQRLVRKLCATCKQAHTPSPEVLRALGLPGARIKELFDPPREIDVDNLCPDCRGLGYLGRTPIMEILVVDDEVRQTLIRTPKLDALRAAAKQAGMRTLHEEGIQLVTRGVTSIAELKRALAQ